MRTIAGCWVTGAGHVALVQRGAYDGDTSLALALHTGVDLGASVVVIAVRSVRHGQVEAAGLQHARIHGAWIAVVTTKGAAAAAAIDAEVDAVTGIAVGTGGVRGQIEATGAVVTAIAGARIVVVANGLYTLALAVTANILGAAGLAIITGQAVCRGCDTT